MRKFGCAVVLSFSFNLFPAVTFAAPDDHWDTQFGAPGADGLVFGITCSGADVYVTGTFTSAGEAGTVGIAKWNGANWSGFGSGFAIGANPVGFSVATRGSEVYVGGAFITNISGVAIRNFGKWNGSAWSEVGGGINGIVQKLLFKNNDLYVCGAFNQAGGIVVSNIARWDGMNWHALGTGLSGATNGFLGATTMVLDSNGDLIVAGNFQRAGDVHVNNIARWDGARWHAMDSGLFNGGFGLSVNALAVLNNDVYAAGVFKSASGVNATNVARWDGAQWHSMGAGPSGTNYAIAVVGTTIYTAGTFTSIGGVAARNIARWNGSAWEPLAPGTAGEILTRVSALASDGTNLYAGGDFIQAGNAGALAIAKWDGVQWSALTGPKSQGLWLSPGAVAADDNDVYIGGTVSGLRIAGGLRPNGIARWDGSGWHDVGGGVSGGSARINVILPHDGNIYVGGNFTMAGNVAARNIAYWDGATWHAMASGLNSNVNALCVHQGQIFAGGAFDARGNETGVLPGVARWNGSDWVEVLGPNWAARIDNVINALVSDGVNLYAGGNYLLSWFETTPLFRSGRANNIGYWDGSYWWPMGNGLTNTVNALVFAGSELYAGGSFQRAGTGTTLRRIAHWDGSMWSEVGGGITNGTVNDLAALGSTLYVGGSFTGVGGISNYNRFLRWTGTEWQMLGTGLGRISPPSFSVADIAISGDDVWLVGTFTHAGGRPSAAIARWNETISFVPPIFRLINPELDEMGRFAFTVSGITSGLYTVQASTNMVDWVDVNSHNPPKTNFTDFNPATLPVRAYRVIVR